MNYRRVEPPSDLSHIIQCLWMVDDGAGPIAPVKQKIIPDGYPELIFHFGDPYRIRLGSQWEKQAQCLVAGQIKKHFFLENTGASQIFGIKLKPSALTHLFALNMHQLTDRVLDVRKIKALHEFVALHKSFINETADRRCLMIHDFLRTRKAIVSKEHPADAAIEFVFDQHGMTGVREIASHVGYTERYLEQLFRKYVGLTPKFFARIVRFSHIFQLITDDRPDWSDVVYRAGFYDQSHFIRNFKSFTGEDPSKYLFSKQDLANFFLNKKTQVA